MPTHTVIITTCENKEQARNLARGLVENKLAACVQLIPIESVYRWEGKIVEAGEFLLLIKTKSELFSEVEKYIISHHSYSTPEIISLPVEKGFEKYLNWIDENTIKGM